MESRSRRAPHQDTWRDDVFQSIHEADEVLLDRQLVSAAKREQNRDLFGELDRECEAFVRFVLRDSYHDRLVPMGCDAMILSMSRLGLGSLCTPIEWDAPLSIRELVDLMRGSAARTEGIK